jgi:S1-C subfamily serine protease
VIERASRRTGYTEIEMRPGLDQRIALGDTGRASGEPLLCRQTASTTIRKGLGRGERRSARRYDRGTGRARARLHRSAQPGR